MPLTAGLFIELSLAWLLGRFQGQFPPGLRPRCCVACQALRASEQPQLLPPHACSNPFAYVAFKSTEPWLLEYVSLDMVRKGCAVSFFLAHHRVTIGLRARLFSSSSCPARWRFCSQSEASARHFALCWWRPYLRLCLSGQHAAKRHAP